MQPEKAARLREALDAIRKRWGQDAVRPLATLTAVRPFIPTGFPMLDEALGDGVPSGCIAELAGQPTAGVTTLALKLTAGMQARGGIAVYVDLAEDFDPTYAAQCGIRLDRLLLVRPPDVRTGLEITHMVSNEEGVGLVIVDGTSEILSAPGGALMARTLLRRLAPVLNSSKCTLAVLTLQPTPSSAVTPHAGLCLLVERQSWMRSGQEIVGYQSKVKVLRNRAGPSGHEIGITIGLNDVIQGDAA